MAKTFAKKDVQPASQEVGSMCVTVGADMDNFDQELQVTFFCWIYFKNGFDLNDGMLTVVGFGCKIMLNKVFIKST